MDERSLPAQRRFVAECAGMAVLALVWLACQLDRSSVERLSHASDNAELAAAKTAAATD
jgi:hypothetical protein